MDPNEEETSGHSTKDKVQMNMKSDLPSFSLRTLVIVLTLMAFPFAAQAQQACPGAANQATMNTAIIFGSTTAHTAFVGAGCVTSAQAAGGVAPIACNQATTTFARFQAVWINTTARTADSNAGCQFVCDNGANTCFVRASDGLPVELLEFSVEDAD